MILTQEQKKLIEAKVADIEKTTAGELKVIVAKSSSRWLYGFKNPVKRKAILLFKKYNLHKTFDRTGVLILFSIKEREFCIYADEGIYQKIGQSQFDAFSDALSEKMMAGAYCEAILELLDKISIPLNEFFPIEPYDKNEISDEVVEE